MMLPDPEQFVCAFWDTVRIDLRLGDVDTYEWLSSPDFATWWTISAACLGLGPDPATQEEPDPEMGWALLIRQYWRPRRDAQPAA